jgi:hypothetical protein
MAIHADGTFKGWVPAAYLDELAPEARARPDNWLVRGDVFRLDRFGDDDDEFGEIFDPGARVAFAGLTTFPTIKIVPRSITPLRYDVVGSVSPNATLFWRSGDIDTLGFGLDECVRFLVYVGDLEIGESISVDPYDWATRYFELRDGAFVEVPAS